MVCVCVCICQWGMAVGQAVCWWKGADNRSVCGQGVLPALTAIPPRSPGGASAPYS